VKLYDCGRAPNARRVRIYLAEKGVTVPTEQVDLAATQHKSEAYTAINPMQRVPALALDDDPVIAEQWQSAAISKRCIHRWRCLAPAPAKWPRSRCGTALPNNTCSSPFPSVPSSAPRHEGTGGSSGGRRGRRQQAAG
jgi:hypothetical protein